MNVLIIGSGGREHAIAWKLSQSPRLNNLYTAPGNPGTLVLGENVSLRADDYPALIKFCSQKSIDLVVVGPEVPLAAGLADHLGDVGIRVFGPRKAAAQIESSKAFSKVFMGRHNIPTARFSHFTEINEAIRFLDMVDFPVVIKASGLAAGKGVVLPESRKEALDTLDAMLIKHEFGVAGKDVIIEERMSGPEISLMAFTDGKTIVPMLPAQDHKRLLDGDKGPNTGGMGAYAPAPICPPELVEEITRGILLPTINGMRQDGSPFIGVLFAGLMLTEYGPKVLEFNCRFGDPETEAVLPLLETDLLDIMEACVDRRLKDIEISWRKQSAACVVLASEGYPGKLVYGRITKGSRQAHPNGVCFHAGTRLEGDRIITAGGRVFSVTAWADTLEGAVRQVYHNVQTIHFDGMQYRRDIAAKAYDRTVALPATMDIRTTPPKALFREEKSQSGRKAAYKHFMQADEKPTPSKSAYADAGVSIDAGNQAVHLMKDAVNSTYTPAVLAGIGSFGGLFDAMALKAMKNPVLVASTDGVGTKVKLAAQAGRYRGIGHDIVNHCIDDILVQGARPLFFMDYFATSRLNPAQTAEVVTGIAEACKEAGMALLGGETAEMPGVYQPGEFDVAGTIVGVLEREDILPRKNLKAGDVLVGLASSGPHTNGYSLIRKIFSDTPLTTIYPELGVPLADALLAPHRSYLNVLSDALRTSHIKALAHLTGGGFIENIPRVLPDNLVAKVKTGSWTVPPLFELIAKVGTISQKEMFRVFNMGIGMVVMVAPKDVDAFRKLVSEPSYIIGELVQGERKVQLE